MDMLVNESRDYFPPLYIYDFCTGIGEVNFRLYVYNLAAAEQYVL